jgi:hypothetical protein
MNKKVSLELPSFARFVNEDWFTRRLELDLFVERKKEDDSDQAAYKGSKHASKMPVVYDYEDWMFLTQFPPWLWKKALQWRYNEGLLAATEERESHPDLDDNVIQNFIPQLTLVDDDGKKYIFDPDPMRGIKDQGRPAIYTGLRTLVQKLEGPMKMSQGHQFKYEGKPAFEPQDPGIAEIDPNQEDPSHPSHSMNYNYGLHDFDLTSPTRIHQDVLDEFLDDKDMPAAMKEKLKENPPHSWAGFKALQHQSASDTLGHWWRAQALGLLGDVGDTIDDPITGKQHKVYRMSPSALSNRPGRHPDPLWADTVGKKEEKPTTWENPDAGYQHTSAGPINLELPAIAQWMHYKVQGPNDAEPRDIRGTVFVPVLNAGTIMPVHKPANDSQRIAFARRKNDRIEKQRDDTDKLLKSTIEQLSVLKQAKPEERGRRLTDRIMRMEKEIPFLQEKLATLTWKLEHPDPKAGQTGNLSFLFQNWDLLSPEQKEYFKTHQRTLLHWAKHKHDKNYKGTDKLVSRSPYIIGFDPLRHQPPSSPSYNMSDEQIEKVFDEYFPANSKRLSGGLVGEARRGVERFMMNRLGWNKPRETKAGKTITSGESMSAEDKNLVLNMMVQMKDEIVHTAATILALNMNSPIRGICDPELGLEVACTKVKKKKKKKKAEEGDVPEETPEGTEDEEPEEIEPHHYAHLQRMNYAYDFAWSISQAALDDVAGTRRQREKQQRFGRSRPGVVRLDRPTAGAEGENRRTELEAPTGGGGGSLGEQMRNQQLSMENPRLWYDTRKHEVDRSQWLSKWFNGTRQEIIRLGGEKHLGSLNTLEEYFTVVTEAAEALYDTALTRTGNEEDAKKETADKLRGYLEMLHPEMATRMKDEDWERALAKYKNAPPSTDEKPVVSERDQWKMDLLKGLLGPDAKGMMMTWETDDNGEEKLVPYRELSLESIATAGPSVAVALIDQMIGLGEWGVKEYGVPLLVRIAKWNGIKGADDQLRKDAVKALRKLGHEPDPKYTQEGQPAQPQQAQQPAPAQTPAQQPANQQPAGGPQIQQMLGDLPTYYKQIVASPEAPKYKLQIRVALDQLREQINQKRQEQAMGKTREGPPLLWTRAWFAIKNLLDNLSQP